MFYKENHFEATRPILDMFCDMYDLHGVLYANRYWIPHHWWRDGKYTWSNCHRISRWPMVRSLMKRS